MESLVTGNDNSVSKSAIGQALVQACKPKAVLTPLHIGLGVQLYRHFGSKFLIGTCTLNNLRISSSYWEVHQFETNAIAAQNIHIPGFFTGSLLQFVADNVNYIIRTRGVHNTFEWALLLHQHPEFSFAFQLKYLTFLPSIYELLVRQIAKTL